MPSCSYYLPRLSELLNIFLKRWVNDVDSIPTTADTVWLPLQDVFLLPLTPWIEQWGSILSFYITLGMICVRGITILGLMERVSTDAQLMLFNWANGKLKEVKIASTSSLVLPSSTNLMEDFHQIIVEVGTYVRVNWDLNKLDRRRGRRRLKI